MSPIRIIIASALITGAIIKAVPALAEPVAAQTSAVVRTADLDLSTEHGRAVLDHRLVAAASKVCGEATPADLAGTNAAIACRASVVSEARASGRALASGNAAARTITIADNR